MCRKKMPSGQGSPRSGAWHHEKSRPAPRWFMAKTWRKPRKRGVQIQFLYNLLKKISKSYYDKMEKNTAENHTSKTLNILHPVCFTTPRTLRFHLSLPSRPPRRKHSGRKWWWSPPAGPGMRITAGGLIWFDWCWTGDEISWLHECIWIYYR